MQPRHGRPSPACRNCCRRSETVGLKGTALLFALRPERAFVLAAPLTEAGKSKTRLDAGTVTAYPEDLPVSL